MHNQGETALQWAAAADHEAVVRLLVEKGSVPHHRANSGSTQKLARWLDGPGGHFGYFGQKRNKQEEY